MAGFFKQIDEDIKDYQEKFPNIANIEKDDWAFNFWILDKLYSIDEQIIENYIIDYNDGGIDCYVWHEEQKDLYLIQNKYYGENTTLPTSYVNNDFLVRGIGALENGTYTHCHELQAIFNKYKEDEEFAVHFRLYVTNNVAISTAVEDSIKNYNQNHAKYDVKAYSLDSLEKEYYGEPIIDKKSLVFEVETVNNGTVLNINTKDYKLAQNIDAKYVFTPVRSLYELIKYANKENYPIFDANIREYLGATGAVNKGMVATLKNPKDRKNFFYYNNGVTVIVNKIDPIQSKPGGAKLRIYNPQIVNGCQTVSTIFETLSEYPDSSLKQDFKDCYVMLKILEISEDTDEMKELNDSIVRYNNSQNAINQKTFAASADEFKRIQAEFSRKGFLVCIKQSDRHKFTEKYKQATELLNKNSDWLDRFGLKDFKKTKDFFIDIEKFLQVIVAFEMGALAAIQYKSKLLVPGTVQNAKVLEFIKSDVTINDLLSLYLLYMRAEIEKKRSDNGKTPIPFYLIHCFAKYNCNGDGTLISNNLQAQNEVEKIIRLYKGVTQAYYTEWTSLYPGKDYNDMIKSQIDEELLDKQEKVVKSIFI